MSIVDYYSSVFLHFGIPVEFNLKDGTEIRRTELDLPENHLFKKRERTKMSRIQDEGSIRPKQFLSRTVFDNEKKELLLVGGISCVGQGGMHRMHRTNEIYSFNLESKSWKREPFDIPGENINYFDVTSFSDGIGRKLLFCCGNPNRDSCTEYSLNEIKIFDYKTGKWEILRDYSSLGEYQDVAERIMYSCQGVARIEEKDYLVIFGVELGTDTERYGKITKGYHIFCLDIERRKMEKYHSFTFPKLPDLFPTEYDGFDFMYGGYFHGSNIFRILTSRTYVTKETNEMEFLPYSERHHLVKFDLKTKKWESICCIRKYVLQSSMIGYKNYLIFYRNHKLVMKSTEEVKSIECYDESDSIFRGNLCILNLQTRKWQVRRFDADFDSPEIEVWPSFARLDGGLQLIAAGGCDINTGFRNLGKEFYPHCYWIDLSFLLKEEMFEKDEEERLEYFFDCIIFGGSSSSLGDEEFNGKAFFKLFCVRIIEQTEIHAPVILFV